MIGSDGGHRADAGIQSLQHTSALVEKKNGLAEIGGKMNKRILIALTCFAFLAFAGSQVFAQSSADQAASQASQSASQAGSQASQSASDAASQAKDTAGQAVSDTEGKAQLQSKLQELSSELNLTDDQKTQLKPILQDEVGKMKAVRDDSSLSPDQKQAKMKTIHDAAKTQIDAILTPEQQKKLQSMKEGSEQQ